MKVHFLAESVEEEKVGKIAGLKWKRNKIKS
jgi:hypothetical protein